MASLLQTWISLRSGVIILKLFGNLPRASAVLPSSARKALSLTAWDPGSVSATTSLPVSHTLQLSVDNSELTYFTGNVGGAYGDNVKPPLGHPPITV